MISAMTHHVGRCIVKDADELLKDVSVASSNGTKPEWMSARMAGQELQVPCVCLLAAVEVMSLTGCLHNCCAMKC